MSGNPFRRAPQPAGDIGPASISVETSTPEKRTKKKRVKIQTPPHSPESPYHGQRRLSAADANARAESPPPPASTAADTDGHLSDSTTTADSDLEQAYSNTRPNSGSFAQQSTGSQPTLPPTGGMRAPYNPFARTLATKEAKYGLLSSKDQSAMQEEQETRQPTGKPALDVDAFTNILLNGAAIPSQSAGATASTTFSRPPESSSGTDTSSSSRRSLFDTTHDYQAESPRTSFDDYHSASDSEDGQVGEDSSLMGINRPEEIAPPAPPKPKHSKGPQIVSFADFDESIPPNFHVPRSGTPPANTHLISILRPSTPRSLSDLNKPLPPPPTDAVENKSPFSTANDMSPSPSSSPATSNLEESAEAKKVPPPPPVSRRQAAAPSRPRSASAETQDSNALPEQRDTPNEHLDPAQPSSKLAPPPPPARKAQPAIQPSAPVTPHPISIPSIQIPAADQLPTTSSSNTKPMPPPPPRRNASKSGDISRSASNASRRSESLSTTSGNAPPAPPPRRGQGSSRNSTDGPPISSGPKRSSGGEWRRFSSQSFGSDRSISGSSLQQVAEPGEVTEEPQQAPPRDLLADMSAFQAEIDALRAKQGS